MKRRFRVTWSPKMDQSMVEIEDPHRLEGWYTSLGFIEWVFGYAWNHGEPYPVGGYSWTCDDDPNGKFVWTGRVAGYPFTIRDLDLADDPSAVVPSESPVRYGP